MIMRAKISAVRASGVQAYSRAELINFFVPVAVLINFFVPDVALINFFVTDAVLIQGRCLFE